MAELNDLSVDRNFNLKEFESPEQLVKIHPQVVGQLQNMRDHLGKPIKVTSGYRTPAHNKAVGGSRGSKHMSGTAADIQCAGVSLDDLVNQARLSGFIGIGIYRSQNFIHVDLGPKRTWNG